MALKAFAGDSVFADVVGSGPPRILALHGWGRSHTDFDGVLAGKPAISVDLPGFGASPMPSGPWGSAEYAEAIGSVWQAFDEPPVVVAHSFGGRVAMQLALQRPMRSLVLIGVPLIRPTTNRKPVVAFRVAKRMHRLGLISDDRIEDYRRKFGSADYRSTEGVMRDVFVKVVNESYEDQLDQLAVPIRMLWGSQDTAAPLTLAQVAYDRLVGSGADVEMEVLDGVGHHVMAERPERVRALIEELLA